MFGSRFYEFERHAHLFEKGDLKYVILDLLKDKPSHGYEIIKALGDSFHGFYTPSAGSVYPTLQLLEDMGYVSGAEQDGKKVYTVTEEGKKFLKEREDTVHKIKAHVRGFYGPNMHKEFRETMREMKNLGDVIRPQFHKIPPEKWNRIREIIAGACSEVEKIVKE